MIYFFLGGFALLSCISIAGANVFITLATLTAIVRCFLKNDDFNFEKYSGFLKVIIFFLLTMLLSAIFTGEIKIGLKRFFEAYVYRLFPLILVIIFINDIKKINKLFMLLISSLTITNVFAITQFLLFENTRANAFAASPMSLAGFLSIMIPAIFAFSIESSNKKRFSLLFIIAIVAAIFNGTRGAWVAIIFTLPIIIVPYVKKLKSLLYILMILVSLLTIAFNNTYLNNRIHSIFDLKNTSNNERILLWESSYNMFKDNPILGVGLGQFAKEYQNNYVMPEAKYPKLGHAHNNLMQMLAETGIIGFVGFVSMFTYFIYKAILFWKKDNSSSMLIFLGGTIGLLIQGLTEFNFGNSAVMKLYWFFMGLSLQYNYFHINKFDKGKNL